MIKSNVLVNNSIIIIFMLCCLPVSASNNGSRISLKLKECDQNNGLIHKDAPSGYINEFYSINGDDDNPIIKPCVVGTDNESSIYLVEPVTGGSILKKYRRDGCSLASWPVKGWIDQIAVANNGYIWSVGSGNCKGLPIVAYKPGKRAPVVDWHINMPTELKSVISTVIARNHRIRSEKELMTIEGEPHTDSSVLAEKVWKAILADRRIDPLNIWINTEIDTISHTTGTVQLNGTVSTSAERILAEKDVKAIPDVKYIHNNLKTKVVYPMWIDYTLSAGLGKVAIILFGSDIGTHGKTGGQANALLIVVSQDGSKIFDAKLITQEYQTLGDDGQIWCQSDGSSKNNDWSAIRFYKLGHGNETYLFGKRDQLNSIKAGLHEQSKIDIYVKAVDLNGNLYVMFTEKGQNNIENRSIIVLDKQRHFVRRSSWYQIHKVRPTLQSRFYDFILIPNGSGFYTAGADDHSLWWEFHALK